MKKIALLCIAIVATIVVKADNISFTISDGIDNAAIKSKMEKSVSRMLNEIIFRSCTRKYGR